MFEKSLLKIVVFNCVLLKRHQIRGARSIKLRIFGDNTRRGTTRGDTCWGTNGATNPSV